MASGGNNRKKINAVLGERKAMKCFSSLDTAEAFSISTFTVPVYLHCLLFGQTTLGTHWQLKWQVVDGKALLSVSVIWLFLTCSQWWCGIRHFFPWHIVLIIQNGQVKADLTLLSFTCCAVGVVSDITRF